MEYQQEQPEYCEDCGHFHDSEADCGPYASSGFQWGVPCGDYRCCQS